MKTVQHYLLDFFFLILIKCLFVILHYNTFMMSLVWVCQCVWTCASYLNIYFSGNFPERHGKPCFKVYFSWCQNDLVTAGEVKVFKLGVDSNSQCLVFSADYTHHVLRVMSETKVDQSLIGEFWVSVREREQVDVFTHHFQYEAQTKISFLAGGCFLLKK